MKGFALSVAHLTTPAICKIARGVVADRNITISFVATFVAGLSGVIFAWLGIVSPFILCAGIAIFGFFYAACMVFIPCIAQRLEQQMFANKRAHCSRLCNAVALNFCGFNQSKRCGLYNTVITIK